MYTFAYAQMILKNSLWSPFTVLVHRKWYIIEYSRWWKTHELEGNIRNEEYLRVLSRNLNVFIEIMKKEISTAN